jgi:hypothetical protein
MAGLADLFGGAAGGAASDFMPFIGPLADLAQGRTGAAVGAGIGTLFGPIGTFAGGILGGMLDTHGGPKIESGYSTSGFDPNTRMGEDNFTPVGSNLRRGLQNPNQDKAIVDAIQGKYNSILSQYGIKGDPLEIGAFTSFDPKGTAQTQFGLNAFLDGQNIYNRQDATGGFENVGRNPNDFMSALNTAGMGVLSGALGHYGLKVDPTTGAIDASGIQAPKPQSNNGFGAGTIFNGLGLLNNGSSNSTGSNMGINASPSFGGLGLGGGSGGGDSTGGFGMGDLSGIISQLGGLGNIGAQLIPGLVGANQQQKAGQTMIDFLKNQQDTMQQQGQTAHQGLMDFINGQQGKIDNLYNPGTPEANLLQQQMDRTDAAAGRNSQYGVRSVDLAAKLAGLKGGLDAQFAGSAIPAVNSSFNQAASNTNSFTQGTSRALADALGVRSNAFNSLLSGLGALNQRTQTGGLPSNIGGGNTAGAGGANFGGLSNLFNNTFGGGFSGGSDSLTGLGVDGSIPFGSGFNFGNPILDSNGIGSIGSAGGTGIGFGNFGTGLDSFSGSAFNSLPDVSDALDWFL